MAVTAKAYTKFSHSLNSKLANIGTDTIKCALFSAYTSPSTNVQSAQFFADVTAVATELSGAGYTAGGNTLTSVTITDSGAVTTIGATAAIPSWTSLAGSPAFAVFYDSTPGTAATNPVICYWDLGGSQTPGTTFTLTVSGTGLVTFTAV
jgi:hypothetical protein